MKKIILSTMSWVVIIIAITFLASVYAEEIVSVAKRSWIMAWPFFCGAGITALYDDTYDKWHGVIGLLVISFAMGLVQYLFMEGVRDPIAALTSFFANAVAAYLFYCLGEDDE